MLVALHNLATQRLDEPGACVAAAERIVVPERGLDREIGQSLNVDGR